MHDYFMNDDVDWMDAHQLRIEMTAISRRIHYQMYQDAEDMAWSLSIHGHAYEMDREIKNLDEDEDNDE